jgi:hypothetical protein
MITYPSRGFNMNSAFYAFLAQLSITSSLIRSTDLELLVPVLAQPTR